MAWPLLPPTMPEERSDQEELEPARLGPVACLGVGRQSYHSTSRPPSDEVSLAAHLAAVAPYLEVRFLAQAAEPLVEAAGRLAASAAALLPKKRDP